MSGSTGGLPSLPGKVRGLADLLLLMALLAIFTIARLAWWLTVDERHNNQGKP